MDTINALIYMPEFRMFVLGIGVGAGLMLMPLAYLQGQVQQYSDAIDDAIAKLGADEWVKPRHATPITPASTVAPAGWDVAETAPGDDEWGSRAAKSDLLRYIAEDYKLPYIDMSVETYDLGEITLPNWRDVK